MKRSSQYALAGITALALSACAPTAEYVTPLAVKERTKTWSAPKFSWWEYVGSTAEYDYFDFKDLGINHRYCVSRGAFSVPKRYEYSKWRPTKTTMPWGALARLEKTRAAD